MNPLAAAVVIAVLVLGAAAVGLVLRSRSGRRRRVKVSAIAASDVGLSVLGDLATVVQFSTEYCSRCPGVRRALHGELADRDGVTYTDVDLTHRPELASRLRVLQTPTILVVDSTGHVVSRHAGVVSIASIRTDLDALRKDGHVQLVS
ncbi:MAG: thioredoxin family protein [Mycetocola sp.]